MMLAYKMSGLLYKTNRFNFAVGLYSISQQEETEKGKLWNMGKQIQICMDDPHVPSLYQLNIHTVCIIEIGTNSTSNSLLVEPKFMYIGTSESVRPNLS